MNQSPVGYQALIERYQLNVIPHYRSSYIKMHGQPKTYVQNHYEIHEYSKNYALAQPNDPFAQLEFALKYDGVNLTIIHELFKKTDKEQLTTWIQAHPTGKYTRITWYLYETLMTEKLPIPDVKKIKYVDLLDPKKYFTTTPEKSPRHGVNNNLLGNINFCPIIRRTPELEEYIEKQLDLKAKAIIQQYDPAIIARANNYLLAKETMSSYEIEHERPNKLRAAKFINLLQKADSFQHLTKAILIECQNTIVDPRFIDSDYRKTQNYVGENLNQYFQKIHFISPKPGNLSLLMQGLLDSLERMLASNCHPVIIAAAISFGFVFLHPFEDGNGRIHRFLMHYILSRTQFTPQGIIFPVSAIILENIKAYDAALETFSMPIMEKITDYHLDNSDGTLTVNQETLNLYQSIDFTYLTEYLFACIEETIALHFKHELDFLVSYDTTKQAIQSIIDMPDKYIDLFIRSLMQNNGTLSKNKRKKHFDFLSEKEVEALTQIVTTNMIKP